LVIIFFGRGKCNDFKWFVFGKELLADVIFIVERRFLHIVYGDFRVYDALIGGCDFCD
jgi:galactokinase/mevalonate kinase-like predicted kinase